MIVLVKEALYDKLAAASGVTDLVSTRIYWDQAPEGATLPYIIFNLNSGGPVAAQYGKDDIDQMVTIVGVSTLQATVLSIADAVKTALHRERLTLTGWTDWAETRLQSPISYVENEDRKQYHYAGGLYRVRLVED